MKKIILTLAMITFIAGTVSTAFGQVADSRVI
jgi:hypothetical protein